MTHPPDLVEVVCLRCGTVCTAYLREPVDHQPAPWHGEDWDIAANVCPECGAALGADGVIELDVLGAHPSR